jgi:hypothetical protein
MNLTRRFSFSLSTLVLLTAAPSFAADLVPAEPATAPQAEVAPGGGVPNAAVKPTDELTARPAPEAPVTDPLPPLTPTPAPAPVVAPQTTGGVELPAWIRNVSVGGGATLWHYYSFDSKTSNFSAYNARLTLDGRWGAFGLHIEPRFRDTKLRPYFDAPVWLQEVYGSASLDPVVIKVGKVYKQSGGLFWDNSFYGNVQVYDGIKLDPNYGVSVEGSVGKALGVDFAAQFFVVDGSTNVSLQGRDTISVTNENGVRSRRKNTLAARVSPFYKLGEGSAVRLGLSAERFQAGLPGGDRNVSRLAADASFTYSLGDAGNFGVWGEYLHQDGRHVVDHPLVGGASKNTHYALVGGEYNFWKLTARYNVSYADYRSVSVSEIMHVPALRYAFNEHLGILGELVIWRQHTPTADIKYDTSSNLTLNGQF